MSLQATTPTLIFVLAQEDHIGDGQLVGIAHLGLELLLLAVELGADARLPQLGGQRDGGGRGPPS